MSLFSKTESFEWAEDSARHAENKLSSCRAQTESKGRYRLMHCFTYSFLGMPIFRNSRIEWSTLGELGFIPRRPSL